MAAGFVVWLTGLSGAGKTTLGIELAARLESEELVVDHLDGDQVRIHLSDGLGFSRADRDRQVARMAWVASRVARAGAAVIVSAISPFEDGRRRARAVVTTHSPFVEVHVATPLEECARRDVKGLYARALAGELPEFTGISSPYETPQTPELRLDTSDESVQQSASRVLAVLARQRLI